MSKYEIDVLKDLKDSKRRVMTNVMEQITKREVKKNQQRWHYGVLTVIVTACIALFVYTQFSQQKPQSASEVTILDEELWAQSIELEKAISEDDEIANVTFKLLLENDAYYAYAISLGMELKEDEILKEEMLIRNRLDQAFADESNGIKEGFSKLSMTKEAYLQNRSRQNAIKNLALNGLLKQYYEQYEGAFPFHARLAINERAMDYFTTKYAKKIAYLEEKFQVSSKEFDFVNDYKSGYVVAFESDRFLVVSGVEKSDIGRLSNDEIIKKQSNGVWFPIHDVKNKISIGDKVRVTFNQEDDTISDSYDYAADLDTLEVIK